MTHRTARCVTSSAAFIAAGALLLSGAAYAAPAPTATTTTVEVKPTTVAYGEVSQATVSVDAAKGPKPAGNAVVTVGDKTVTVAVANGGRATTDLPLLDASSTPYSVEAAFTPTDAAAFAASSATTPATLTVTKDATTAPATVRYRKAKKKAVARVAVTSAHGQVPTGNAKFVLKRNGKKVASAKVELTSKATAKFVFTKVSQKGNYKVIAKYLGSTNFLRSKSVAKFQI